MFPLIDQLYNFQDLFYFPFRPAEKIVAAWTAMEKVEVENGCLFVVPRSHNYPLYDHNYQKVSKLKKKKKKQKNKNKY